MFVPKLVYKYSNKTILKKCKVCKKLPDVRHISFTNLLMCESKKDDPQDSPLKKLLEESSTFQNISPLSKEQQWATLPYTEDPNTALSRKQGDYFKNPGNDPRDSSIILFPGQGTQYVGMAKELMKFPMAKDLFELANHILGYDLLKVCLKGPQEKLDQTQFAQPAIMVSSLAAIEQLKEERPNAVANCVATAGFSLGEITALVFAGSLGFERALQLVNIRAEAMQLAAEAYKGGMLTIMIRPDSKLNYACLKAKDWAVDKGDPIPECKIANYLYPDCKVVSGSESALQYIEENYKIFNLRKVKRLPVSGAFHSKLMLPAMETFQKSLEKTRIEDPAISVYSNVTGKKYKHFKNRWRKQELRILPSVSILM
nr:probable malonyl-CoA-acyl carrier protein transacylase, mitochondrial [Leptinotarsa decemlineata]